ncbi:MAG: hypothetical protein R3E98_02645 [Gemmatimonadota bacterium]
MTRSLQGMAEPPPDRTPAGGSTAGRADAPAQGPPCPFPDDTAIERIATGLITRTLPRVEWTHAAHWAAAFWITRAWGREAASMELPGLIRRYNEATGTPNSDSSGYHETITVASLRAVDAALAAAPTSEPLHRVCALLLASELGTSDWVLRHWTRERLFSVEARRFWVEPDLQPLPF